MTVIFIEVATRSGIPAIGVFTSVPRHRHRHACPGQPTLGADRFVIQSLIGLYGVGHETEGLLRQLEAELGELDANVERLIARDDDDYGKWKTHAHKRRYEPPQAERLFDLEFVIA